MLPGKPQRDAVAVAVILNQAGGPDSDSLLHIAVKGASQRTQFSALSLEHFRNGAILLFRVRSGGQFLTA